MAQAQRQIHVTTGAVAVRQAHPRCPVHQRHVPAPEDLTIGPRTDPTRISPIQERYAVDIRKTLRQIRGFVRTGIVDNDALKLRDDGLAASNSAAAASARAGPRVGPGSPQIRVQAFGPPRQFPFETDPELQDAFVGWLDEQYDRGIVEGVGHESYVRASYKRGVDHADHALNRAGIIPEPDEVEGLFNAPIHRDQLAIARTRTLDAVQTVGADMRSQVRRELAQGMAEGLNPRGIASRINDRVDKVARHRLEMVARTETAYAQSEATLTRYEQQGVDDVGVVAEFTTAGDSRVCPECMGLEGSQFTTKEARGVIPVHPNCRCAWVPISNADHTPTPRGSSPHRIDNEVDGRDIETYDEYSRPDGWDSIDDGMGFHDKRAAEWLEDNTEIEQVDIDLPFMDERQLKGLKDFGDEVIRLDRAGLTKGLRQLKVMNLDEKRYNGLYMRRNPSGSPVDEARGIAIDQKAITDMAGRSTPSRTAGRRTFRHELGHHRHAMATDRGDVPEDWYHMGSGKATRKLTDDEKDYIEENFSSYGAKNYREFIAEMHTSLADPNETVDDERLLELYHRYLGNDGN